VRPGIIGEIGIKGDRRFKLQQLSPGLYQIDLKKGEEVCLQAGARQATHERRGE
jgi:hypothetical protein